MRTIEAEVVTDATLTHDGSAERSGSYDSVRFNATRHGILSKLVVLAHEDASEFCELVAALIEEHRPAGPTERHLIEELKWCRLAAEHEDGETRLIQRLSVGDF